MLLRLFIVLLIFSASQVCVAQLLSARAKKELVQRLDIKSEHFQKTLAKGVKPDLVSPLEAHELVEFAEDLSLLIDGLGTRVIDQQYVAEILRTAFDVERRILSTDVSANVVLTWTALHAELDLLAKCYGVRWTEAVVSTDLIAQLGTEVSSFEDDIRLQMSRVACVSHTADSGKQMLLDRINYSSALPVTLQLFDLNKRVRRVAVYFRDCSFGSRLKTDWRRLSTQSEALMRLLSLDSPKASLSQFYTRR